VFLLKRNKYDGIDLMAYLEAVMDFCFGEANANCPGGNRANWNVNCTRTLSFLFPMQAIVTTNRNDI